MGTQICYSTHDAMCQLSCALDLLQLPHACCNARLVSRSVTGIWGVTVCPLSYIITGCVLGPFMLACLHSTSHHVLCMPSILHVASKGSLTAPCLTASLARIQILLCLNFVSICTEVDTQFHACRLRSTTNMVASTATVQHQHRRKRVLGKLNRFSFLHSVTSLSGIIFGDAGPGDLPGLTDDDKPRMRGPKRASKIRKLFNLTKDDDVRKYVNTYRRSFEGKDGKTHSKAPKIQRLVTPLTLQRKRRRASLNRQRHEKVGILCQAFFAVLLGSDRNLLLEEVLRNPARRLQCISSMHLLPAASLQCFQELFRLLKRGIVRVIPDTSTNLQQVLLDCWYVWQAAFGQSFAGHRELLPSVVLQTAVSGRWIHHTLNSW